MVDPVKTSLSILKVMNDEWNKLQKFYSDCGKLKKTLERLNEVQNLNKLGVGPKSQGYQKLLEDLDQADNLVKKCTKLNMFFACLYKSSYSGQLSEVQGSIETFITQDINLEIYVGDVIKNAKLLPKVTEPTFGLLGHLYDVKNLLFKEGVNVVGVTGIPGIGKSTLVKKLCWETDVQEKFNNTILYKDLQGCLDINVAKKEVSESYLKAELRKGIILVILDNVSNRSDLDQLMEVFDDKAFYKIVFTSRASLLVEHKENEHEMTKLGQADALSLFQHLAFPKPSEITDKQVNEIVKYCYGHPMIVSLVGKTLKEQGVSAAWRTAVKQLKKGNIEGSVADTTVMKRLTKTLELLPEKLRKCFQEVGLFPLYTNDETSWIPAASLFDMWIVLRDNVDDDDVAYSSILRKLESSNLVELVERTRKGAGSEYHGYDDLYVYQHSLLRQLALYDVAQSGIDKPLDRDFKEYKQFTSKAQLVVVQSSKQLENATRIVANKDCVSFSVGTDLSSQQWSDVQFPEAQVLVLALSANVASLPSFLSTMNNLKALIVTKNTSGDATKSDADRGTPKEGELVKGSFKHLKRVRLQGVALHNCLSMIEGPLESLESLSLCLCDVDNTMISASGVKFPTLVPKMKFLTLDYCKDITELPEGLLDNPSLETISITNCVDLTSLPAEIGKLKNVKILRLSTCSSLNELPEEVCQMENLEYLDISDCSSLECLPEDIGNLTNLRKIDMRSCQSMVDIPESAKKLKCLTRVVVDEGTATLWDSVKRERGANLTVEVVKPNIGLGFLGII